MGYSTWESTLTIESAFNTDYTDYQCYATNELGEDTFNISLTKRSRPEAPVNLEVIMKDYRTVQLRVSLSRLVQAQLLLNPQTTVSLCLCLSLQFS